MKYLLAILLSLPAAAQQRVFVAIFDDVGRDILAVAPTPNLDALASQGVTFTAACMGARCTPTRASFFSGLYPFRRDHLLGRTLGQNVAWELADTGYLLADRLKACGLTSAFAGKYHVGAAPWHPIDAGFSEWRGTQGNLIEAEPVPGINGDYYWWREDWADDQGNGGAVVRGPTGDYVTTRTTDDAIGYMQAHRDLVVMAYHAIHVPMHVPPQNLHTQGFPTDQYGKAVAMLEACDTEFGRAWSVAQAEGYVTIAWSDEGSPQAIGGPKGTYYDPNIMPWMFAEGPGIPAGAVCPHQVESTDLYRTVLDLEGVPMDPFDATTDSISFAPLLANPTGPATRDLVYVEGFSHNGVPPTAQNWDRCLRWVTPTGRVWKLIENRLEDVPPLEEWELYDLLADPDETTNLAYDPAFAGKLAQMQGMMPQ